MSLERHVETHAETHLLPAVLPNGDAPPVVFDPLSQAGLSWTTLPLDDQAGRELHVRALEGTHPLLRDQLNRTLLLRAVVIHPYDKMRDDGEFVTLRRLVVICDDGSMYQSGGQATEVSVGRLIRAYGSGVWDPPIEVTVASAANKHGGSCYKLIPTTEGMARMPWKPVAPAKGGKRG
jgi:hypothetical protein